MQHLHHVNTLEDMRHIAGEIVLLIDKHPIITLTGDLGVGKTTLTQMICEQLGVTELVTSPTYTLVNEYEGKHHKIYHFDLYRLNQVEELDGMGFTEYLDSGNICLIEWPQIAENYLNDFNILDIIIHKQDESRTVELNYHTITA